MIASGTDFFRTGLTGMGLSLVLSWGALRIFVLTKKSGSIRLTLVTWSDQLAGNIFAEFVFFVKLFLAIFWVFPKNPKVLQSGSDGIITIADDERMKKLILTGEVEGIAGLLVHRN